MITVEQSENGMNRPYVREKSTACMHQGAEGETYSFVACLGHLTIDLSLIHI